MKANKKIKPPALANWLLKYLSLYENKHSILGDFAETYLRILKKDGVLKANCWYWLQVFRSIPEHMRLNLNMGIMMFSNYLKITLRNIKNNKSYTIINISGLTAGIVCCLLILLYVRYELSYDKFYEKADSIYRIAMEDKTPNDIRHWGWTSVMMATVLKNEYPEVKQCTRILTEMGETQITYGENSNIEKRVMYADSLFFDLFTIPLISGNEETVLKNPNSVILSEAAAWRYFGNEDPVGKTIKVRNWWAENTDHIITGVAENIPPNAHFHFDFLISYNSTRVSQSRSWGYTQIFNYILLEEGCDALAFEAKLPDLVRKYDAPIVEEVRNISYDEYLALGYDTRLYLQPLKDIHLKSKLEHEIEATGNITYVSMFTIIAVFILLIACINFMNLSTARSVNRAKEVGVRKTLGSFRKQLVIQFLTESVLLSFIALVIAMLIIAIILPTFRAYSGTDLRMDYFENSIFLPGLLVFAAFVGILSGCYPAFFLSSFKPISVLKGAMRPSSKGHWVRNGLVVFQFIASIALISSTLIIKNQIDYMLNKDLGYNKDHVIVLSNGQSLGQYSDAFKNEVKRDHNVINIGGSGGYPARALHVARFRMKDADPSESVLLFNTSIDYDFIETIELEIVQGRGFSREMSMDTSSVVINEAAVRALGVTDPIGKSLDSFRPLNIIGVVKDFHFRSLHYDVGPLVLFLNRRDYCRFISIRVRAADIQQTLSQVQNIWDQFAQGQPFNYTFLDQNIAQLYSTEDKTGEISTIFSFLAIMIGCLGLFGLATYTAEQRTKEIGIRKVLGASVTNILILLSKEFAKLVFFAFVIAIPISYFIMNNWLKNFSFSISISAYIYMIAGFATLFIALITVSYQVIKAANQNPVDSLMYE